MADKSKSRADICLVARGLVESRTKAQALIMAGLVYSGTARINKPGDMIKSDQALLVKGRDHPYVSRGGLKLEKGLAVFEFDPSGKSAIDLGASTGGFTDLLLQRGALKVYAVDVGSGQLAWSLRQDPRVIVHEKTNARYLDRSIIPDAVDLLVCDASFISLKLVLPAAMALVKPGGALIALIKPQFEVGKSQVGKGGVVRDKALHEAVCHDMGHWLDEQPFWSKQGLTESPIMGPEGNIEFLLYGRKASHAPKTNSEA